MWGNLWRQGHHGLRGRGRRAWRQHRGHRGARGRGRGPQLGEARQPCPTLGFSQNPTWGCDADLRFCPKKFPNEKKGQDGQVQKKALQMDGFLNVQSMNEWGNHENIYQHTILHTSFRDSKAKEIQSPNFCKPGGNHFRASNTNNYGITWWENIAHYLDDVLLGILAAWCIAPPCYIHAHMYICTNGK